MHEGLTEPVKSDCSGNKLGGTADLQLFVLKFRDSCPKNSEVHFYVFNHGFYIQKSYR